MFLMCFQWFLWAFILPPGGKSVNSPVWLVTSSSCVCRTALGYIGLLLNDHPKDVVPHHFNVFLLSLGKLPWGSCQHCNPQPKWSDTPLTSAARPPSAMSLEVYQHICRQTFFSFEHVNIQLLLAWSQHGGAPRWSQSTQTFLLHPDPGPQLSADLVTGWNTRLQAPHVCFKLSLVFDIKDPEQCENSSRLSVKNQENWKHFCEPQFLLASTEWVCECVCILNLYVLSIFLV